MSDAAPWLYPIGIGIYDDARFDRLDVDADVARIGEILAEFGVESEPWIVADGNRDERAVDKRLRAWWESPDDRNSIFYWVGHGWADGHTQALAHAESPYEVSTSGVTPSDISNAIVRRERHGNRSSSWALIVINACMSRQFARSVNNDLENRHDLSRYIILGVTDGRIRLGTFANKLEQTLRNVFGADDSVDLVNLVFELRDRLPGSYIHPELRRTYLHRPDQLAGLTLDVLPDLEAVVKNLPEDERAHFLPKAQSAEIGELFWYFEGRDAETNEIVSWLATHDSGLLVVTGPAGSGKSALLGHVLSQSRPVLRERLVSEVGLRLLPDHLRPPDNVFSASFLLTGATVSDIPTRLAKALGLSHFPADAELNEQIDWLLGRLGRQRDTDPPVTILLDALDEAAQPVTIVRRLLAEIARLNGVRVIVGTRQYANEGVEDSSEPFAKDILNALSAEGASTVVLTYDPGAIDRYVRHRLIAAGIRLTTDADAASLIAAAVNSHHHEFLYARLVLHELIAAADSAKRVTGDRLNNLLRGDYRSLFLSAVARLASLAPVNRALLIALALARGRGLPIQNGTWATVAQANGMPEGSGISVTADMLDTFLEQAAPYIMRDAEAGQTVYRLAHRTFAEHLTVELTTPHRRVVEALIAAAEPGRDLNPYVVHHLADHAADDPAGWKLIARHTWVLDQLDPTSVTAHAMRYGLSRIPEEIAAVAVMRDRLLAAAPPDRPGLREIGMAKLGVPVKAVTAGDSWIVRWASIAQETRHLTFGRRHNDDVRALVSFTWIDGRRAIASGGSDCTIRVWDADQGTEIRAAWSDPDRAAIWSMAALPSADSSELIVYGGNDGVLRIWNPTTDEVISWFAHTGAVKCLTVVDAGLDGPRIVSGGLDGAIRQWTTQGHQVGRDWSNAESAAARTMAESAAARTLIVIGRPEDQPHVVSCGEDGALRLWDPETGSQLREFLTDPTGTTALCVAALRTAENRVVVVSGSDDGALLMWDPEANTLIRGLWIPDVGSIVAVITVPDPVDGRPLVVAGTSQGKVCLWAPADDTLVGPPWTVPTKRIRALAAVPGSRLTLVATAGDDRTVRLWEPIAQSGRRTDPAGAGNTQALATLPRYGDTTLLAAGQSDGSVRVWSPHETDRAQLLWAAHADGVTAATSLTIEGRNLLISSGGDYLLRAWDPETGRQLGPPYRGHSSPIRALVPLHEPGAPAMVVSASSRSLHVWNPLADSDTGDEWTGHLAHVGCLATVHDRNGHLKIVSGSLDRTIRMWDPADGRQMGNAWKGHGNEVTALAAAPAGTHDIVISASKDRTMRWWDPDTGEQMGEPLTIGAEVRFLRTATGPNGELLLVGALGDRTVRLWDPVTHTEVRRANVGYDVTALGIHDDTVVIGIDQGVVAISFW